MNSQYKNRRSALFTMALLTAAIGGVASAQEINVALPSPTADRWVYPFNGTPGARPVIPIFGAIGEEFFDDRDGQCLLGYDTSSSIQTGLGQLGYTIQSATLTVMISNDLFFTYDPTLDAYQTYIDGSGSIDNDPGRPVILSATGFRDRYTGLTYGDDGPYSTAGDPNLRAAFPADIDNDGELIDITNNVVEGFDPQPMAVGVIERFPAGDLVPEGSILKFDLDVSDPKIQCYLNGGLSDGYISLSITSLNPASQPGTGPAAFPEIYASENIAVSLGLAQAPSLNMVVTEHTDPPQAGDANRDGHVDLSDFSLLLIQFGECYCCSADFNQDGFVDLDDFSTLLINYGCCP